MAKTTRRRSPAKRKPAAKSPSGLALSGWLVAAGLGAAWMGPQAGLWSKEVLENVPSFEALRTMVQRPETRPVREAESDQRKVAAKREDAAAVQVPQKKPVLPPIASDTIADIVRKAAVRPSVPLAAPQPKGPTSGGSAFGGAASAMAPPVPAASIPFVTAAIRKEPQTRPPTARPGDLAIRRYPFTTAPAVAYVGDLRTVRILGGEGDWKKVEISATGVIGWLRLQRLGARDDGRTAGATASVPVRPPAPATALLQEAEAAGAR